MLLYALVRSEFMTSSLRVASVPILAAGVLVSQSAMAQNSWFVEDVPDFDQRRSASTGIVGLPADGGMYCVPTSTLNWFAYLANRGTPQPGTLAGPRDWQSQTTTTVWATPSQHWVR